MDRNEICKLYEQYGSWVFKRARNLLKNEEEAWDTVQEVFLKVMRAGNSFRRESSPWTWIYRITTNHCLNLIRRRNTWQNIEGTLKQSLPVAAENPSIHDCLFVQLVGESDKQTQTIALAYYQDGLTQEEIGNMLNISRKTVGIKLAKFEEKARRILAEKKI